VELLFIGETPSEGSSPQPRSPAGAAKAAGRTPSPGCRHALELPLAQGEGVRRIARGGPTKSARQKAFGFPRRAMGNHRAQKEGAMPRRRSRRAR
jgi:hypothetical protein